MRQWLFLFFAPFLLAACEGDPILSGLSGNGSDRVAVADGSIIVAGPPGYCPDRSATYGIAAKRSLVVLGGCASVRNNPNGTNPQIPGVLTASVSRNITGNAANLVPQIERFFRSTQGRAALSRSGQASSVRILQSQRKSGVYIMKLTDSSPNGEGRLDPQYWRAVFDQNGRIITASVFAFRANPMSDSYARSTLIGFVERMRKENSISVGGSQNSG